MVKTKRKEKEEMNHEAGVGAKTREAIKYRALDSDRLCFKSLFSSCVIWASSLTFLRLSVLLSKEAPEEHPLQEAAGGSSESVHWKAWGPGGICFLTFSPHGTLKTLPHI